MPFTSPFKNLFGRSEKEAPGAPNPTVLNAKSETEKTLALFDAFLGEIASYYVSYYGQTVFDKTISKALVSRNADAFVTVHDGKIDTSELKKTILSAEAHGGNTSVDWSGIYKSLFTTVFDELKTKIGEKPALKQINRLFNRYKETYGLEDAQRILGILPSDILDLTDWLALNSKEELEKKVTDKTRELKEVNDSLEKKVSDRTQALNETIARLKIVVEQQEKSSRLLIKRDMELVRANEMLRELDQRKSEFLSVVAHQLRTPLSGIKWTLNMLLTGDLGPLNDDQKTFLMKSYESNQRMIGLVEDMLVADRVGSGKAHFNFAPISVLDIIDAIVYELAAKISEKEIEIRFVGTEKKLPNAYGDKDKVRDVVQNLLDNAVKYTPEKGVITISIEEDGDFIKTSVSDTGIGIPLSEQKNIFNRFFRAPNALKEIADGSGLGLFIVKGIVDKHGGSIWFESAEGKGTTFTFTLRKA